MKKRLMNLIKTTLFLLLIFNIQISFSQISSDFIKYWFYRSRLEYFVVPGDKIGESQIICVRNKIFSDNDSNNIVHPDQWTNADYGQPGKHTGFYIGTLATEYYLLNKNGQYDDAAKTYNELFLALNAVKVYWDEKAEDFWPDIEYNNTSYTDPFNGFFIRGNVPCDFYNPYHPNGVTATGESHLRLLNKRLSQTDVFSTTYFRFGNDQEGYLPRGHPGYIDHRTCDHCGGEAEKNTPPNHTNHKCQGNWYNPHNHDFHPESMSQDEAIGLLMGIELTKKLTGGICYDLASIMKEKIYKYLLNMDDIFGTSNYRIYEPDGYGICTAEGGFTIAFAVPLLHEFGLEPSTIPKIIWSYLGDGPHGQYPDLQAVLGAISNTWSNTGYRLKLVTKRNNWETFYVLLWEVLHNESLSVNKQETIVNKSLDQLNAAPCNGPYNYGSGYFSGNGWASTYKWCKTAKEQDGAEIYYGNYHGLDYMLFYNLYHIINGENCPYYVNYTDKNLIGTIPISSHSEETGNGAPIEYEYTGTGDSPLKFVAFNTIISTQKILFTDQVIDYILHPETSHEEIHYRSVAGNVTYVAGTSIHLKPGFRAEEGSYFHAYIEDVHCNEFPGGSKDTTVSDYPDNMYTPYFDSLISLPKTPYDLEVEDSNGISNLVTLECPVDTLRFRGINGDTVDDQYTYFWDFGNGITSTRVDPEIYYEPGTYDLTLILADTSGVSDTMKVILEVPDCGTSSVIGEDSSEISLAHGKISIVPNPNNGEMWLILENIVDPDLNVMIYDITGRVVYEKQITYQSGRIHINTSGLEYGIYLFAVISSERRLLAKEKLVIIR